MQVLDTTDENDPAVLIELAEADISRRDFASARAGYETALARLRRDRANEPLGVRGMVGLGWTMQGLGDCEAALRWHEEALAAQLRLAPGERAALCTIRRGIAAALIALGRLEEAQEQNSQVLAMQRELLDAHDPEVAQTLNIMGETAARLERYDEARRHQEAALAILRAVHPAGAPEVAAALTNLGVSLYRLDEQEAAERTLREALTLDPGLLLAAENLIHVLYKQGRITEGGILAAEKYRRQSFVVQPPPARVMGTLLVLWSLDGNIPKKHLLARLPLTLVDWHIQYASAEHERQLPPYDAVFSLMGDPDQGAAALAAAVAFRDRCKMTLLNDPVKVQRTRRDMIPEVLAGIADLVIPPVVRLSATDLRGADCARLLGKAGVSLPFLLRNAGRHGGESVQLIFDDAGLAQAAADIGDDDRFYATGYHEYKSADGFYRKYRVVFVDRVPLPYHLAISSDWLVHYFSADMAAHPWKLAEEQRYLEDAPAVLGRRAWAVLEQIAQRMDLDYCGADFTLLPDGRVLLFEANATMLVHPEEDAPLAHKNPYVSPIFAAFDEMVRRSLPAGNRWREGANSEQALSLKRER